MGPWCLIKHWILFEGAEPGGLWDPGDLPSLKQSWGCSFHPRSQLQPLLNLTPILREGKTPFTALHFPTCLLLWPEALQLLTHTCTPCGVVVAALTCAPTPRYSCPAPCQGPWQPAPALALSGACSSNTELEVGFNKKIEQTVAIKCNVLPNKLLSCLLTRVHPSIFLPHTFPILAPSWFDLSLYHPTFSPLGIP